MTIEEIKMQELKKQIAEQELKHKQQINDIKNSASKIPGLIAGQSVDNEEINEEFEKALEQWVNQPISTTSTPYPTPPSDYWGIDEYLKRTSPPYYNPYVTNKSLGKNTRIPPRPPDYNSLNNYVNKKSSFEEIIDILFTVQEKKEYLESIGYTMDSSGKFYKADSIAPAYGNDNMHQLFLYEITIKFKNVLLSKGTLKLKL
jgi:hypothetical protein